MNDLAPTFQDDVMRALPHSIMAEKNVLSLILNEPADFLPVCIEAGLTADHFYLPAHQTFFETISHRVDTGKPIELGLLVQDLADRGKLDVVGGPAAIADLCTYAAGGVYGNVNHYLRVMQEKHVLRSLIQFGNETVAAAYETADDFGDVLDRSETRLMAIRDSIHAAKNDEPTKLVIERAMERISAIVRHEKNASGLSTGFAGLDGLGAYLKPGEMFVIAARPSMGKTALMMNIVEMFAVENARNSLVFSAEMTSESLMQRAICSRGKFPLSSIQKGEKEATKSDLLRLQHAMTQWASAPVHIVDKAQITVGEIRAIARRRHRQRPLDLIAIDYLQYLRCPSKQASSSREREIAEISAGIKALAKELKVPVILLAQLNRDAEKRTGKSLGVPRMSDLRESGAIEQDADMIGLLYRKDYYAQDEDQKSELAGQAKLILAKNRNGETGEAPLTFIAPFVRFEDGQPEREFPQPQTPRSRFDD